jgi:hypothetical protein
MSSIPIVGSAADLPGAIARAERSPSSRAHVARRAAELGLTDKIPAAWGMVAAGPREGALGKIGHAIAAAWDEAVHPRGRDGQWIRNGEHVDVFENKGGSARLGQAKVVGNTPDGKLQVEFSSGPSKGQTQTIEPNRIAKAAAAKADLTPGGGASRTPAAPHPSELEAKAPFIASDVAKHFVRSDLNPALFTTVKDYLLADRKGPLGRDATQHRNRERRIKEAGLDVLEITDRAKAKGLYGPSEFETGASKAPELGHFPDGTKMPGGPAAPRRTFMAADLKGGDRILHPDTGATHEVFDAAPAGNGMTTVRTDGGSGPQIRIGSSRQLAVADASAPAPGSSRPGANAPIPASQRLDMQSELQQARNTLGGMADAPVGGGQDLLINDAPLRDALSEIDNALVGGRPREIHAAYTKAAAAFADAADGAPAGPLDELSRRHLADLNHLAGQFEQHATDAQLTAPDAFNGPDIRVTGVEAAVESDIAKAVERATAQFDSAYFASGQARREVQQGTIGRLDMLRQRDPELFDAYAASIGARPNIASVGGILDARVGARVEQLSNERADLKLKGDVKAPAPDYPSGADALDAAQARLPIDPAHPIAQDLGAATAEATGALRDASTNLRLLGRSGKATDDHRARLEAIIANPDQAAAHKDLAALMTSMTLGGKQRKRYRELLDAHHGKAADPASAGIEARATADALAPSNPLKDRLAAKAASPASIVDAPLGYGTGPAAPSAVPPISGPTAESRNRGDIRAASGIRVEDNGDGTPIMVGNAGKGYINVTPEAMAKIQPSWDAGEMLLGHENGNVVTSGSAYGERRVFDPQTGRLIEAYKVGMDGSKTPIAATEGDTRNSAGMSPEAAARAATPAGPDELNNRGGDFNSVKMPTGPYSLPWKETTVSGTQTAISEAIYATEIAPGEPGFKVLPGGKIVVTDPNQALYELDGLYEIARDNAGDSMVGAPERRAAKAKADGLKKLMDAIQAEKVKQASAAGPGSTAPGAGQINRVQAAEKMFGVDSPQAAKARERFPDGGPTLPVAAPISDRAARAKADGALRRAKFNQPPEVPSPSDGPPLSAAGRNSIAKALTRNVKAQNAIDVYLEEQEKARTGVGSYNQVRQSNASRTIREAGLDPAKVVERSKAFRADALNKLSGAGPGSADTSPAVDLPSLDLGTPETARAQAVRLAKRFGPGSPEGLAAETRATNEDNRLAAQQGFPAPANLPAGQSARGFVTGAPERAKQAERDRVAHSAALRAHTAAQNRGDLGTEPAPTRQSIDNLASSIRDAGGQGYDSPAGILQLIQSYAANVRADIADPTARFVTIGVPGGSEVRIPKGIAQKAVDAYSTGLMTDAQALRILGVTDAVPGAPAAGGVTASGAPGALRKRILRKRAGG